MLGLGIERRRRLVEDEQQRLVAHEPAREAELLPLAVRHVDASRPARTELCTESCRQPQDHVFRPGAAWARRISVAYPLLLSALFAWQTASPGWTELATRGAGPWRALPYFTLFGRAWAATESLLFHAKLRRRLSLGLADPVTADRLRLWAIAMISAFAITATSLLLRELGVGMTPLLSAVVVGPLGLLAATAMWLAFLSPRRYRSWVSARIAPARG